VSSGRYETDGPLTGRNVIIVPACSSSGLGNGRPLARVNVANLSARLPPVQKVRPEASRVVHPRAAGKRASLAAIAETFVPRAESAPA